MLSNLKIGLRLGIGFAITLALLIAMATVSVVRINMLDREIGIVINDRFPTTVQSNNIIDAVNNVARQLRNALLYPASETKKQLDSVNEQRKIISDNFAKLEKGIQDEKGKDLMKKALSDRAAYVTTMDRFIELSRVGKRDEAIQLLSGEFRIVQNAYLASISALVDYQSELMVKSGKELDELAAGTARLMMILAVIATLLSIIIGYFITRSITAPTQKLVGGLDKMAVGDKDRRGPAGGARRPVACGRALTTPRFPDQPQSGGAREHRSHSATRFRDCRCPARRDAHRTPIRPHCPARPPARRRRPRPRLHRWRCLARSAAPRLPRRLLRVLPHGRLDYAGGSLADRRQAARAGARRRTCRADKPSRRPRNSARRPARAPRRHVGPGLPSDHRAARRRPHPLRTPWPRRRMHDPRFPPARLPRLDLLFEGRLRRRPCACSARPLGPARRSQSRRRQRRHRRLGDRSARPRAGRRSLRVTRRRPARARSARCGGAMGVRRAGLRRMPARHVRTTSPRLNGPPHVGPPIARFAAFTHEIPSRAQQENNRELSTCLACF